MSEKLYAFLLGLFPSHFRRAYGEDALQLFRDRARDETGLRSRLRLWLDLFADLAISVPREYFHAQPELLSNAAGPNPVGSPTFYVLHQDAPRPGALLLGCMLSCAALLTFSNLLAQGGQHRTLRPSPWQRQAFSSRPAKAAAQRAAQAADAGSFSVTSESANQNLASTSQPATQAASAAATPDPNPELGKNDSSAPEALRPSGSGSAAVQTPAPENVASGVPTPTAAMASAQITPAERHRVVNAAASNLTQFYADHELGQKMAESLRVHEQHGDDNAATDGQAFADLITQQMREVSHDLHLEFVYRAEPLPENPVPNSAPSAGYRDFLEHNNCTFEKVAILSHNVGYLKLNSFPDLSVCEPAARSAMHQLNDADAVIFDLRDNRGGQPEMVMLLAAYLFDHPEYMYNPRENTTLRSWTQSPVPGNKLADKPVFILTSHATWSAAEHFSYDLKMLKRATLVGETTGGGAHSGVFHRLDDHFGIGIPETKPINPFPDADWAVVGITPDVKVTAADALATAQKLALAKLAKQ
jgi:hypothetical protein